MSPPDVRTGIEEYEALHGTGDLWLTVSPDTTDAQARLFFRAKFGYEPDEVATHPVLHYVGPVIARHRHDTT